MRVSEYYHKRADELRQAATGEVGPKDRQTLICFADDLDELADDAAIAEHEQARREED